MNRFVVWKKKENIMSTFVSKATEFVRNIVRVVTDFVRKSPWVAAALAAVLVLLFLVTP